VGKILDFLTGLPSTPNERLYEAALLPEAAWAIETVQGLSAEELWRSQPAIRTVIGFIAGNIAQLGVHTFGRDGEDRVRLRDHPVALLFREPNPDQTCTEMMYALLADWALHDDGYLMLLPDDTRRSGYLLRHIPTAWVSAAKANPWAIETYNLTVPGRRPLEVPAEFIIRFHGWNPNDTRGGVTRLAALKDTMSEQISARKYRKQTWDSGARAHAVITRPPATSQAAAWSPEAKARFIADLKNTFAGNKASGGGGTIILEDGMTMNPLGFNAQEEQFVEAAKLAINTVASVFYINPTMIGQLDNANYANVREFRRALYGDTLGHPIAMVMDRINTFLIPKVSADDVYVEFNVKARLAGSFEEQAAVMSTSVGGPWMSRNEARARENLPAIEGGDELIVPLNVLVGGQASPQDGGTGQASNVDVVRGILELLGKGGAVESKAILPAKDAEPRKFKAALADDERDELTTVLEKFFKRQGDVVRTALGAKADGEWWDAERWNTELADDLYPVVKGLATSTGRRTLKDLELDPDEYDEDQTVNYLAAVAVNTAGRVNTTTKNLLDAARGDSDAIGAVFATAEGSRSGDVGRSLASGVAGFACTEALRQSGHEEKATKSWIVTSKNPRASHAAMNGETVLLSENFSNGAAWPGDAANLDADDLSGCECELEMTIP
jgi:HK97 family phage portal protein